ncbi:MAG: winged helix-turn-helix domain-containing protein [Methanimicrococcus sp.]|nr:winged helix-turn-helix domain-containing protein [Methanimicrococcus sp.]
MKDESMTDILFLSEKRKQILLFLLNGPKTIDEIKEKLVSKSSPLMVQIRILIRNHLVQEEEEGFSLTPFGKYAVQDMKSILEMFSVLDKEPSYWIDVDFSAIPAHLLNRIGDLKNIQLNFPEKECIFDRTTVVRQKLKSAESLIEISSVFRKDYITDYVKIAEKDIGVSFVLTKNVIDRLENEFPEIYYRYMRLKNVRFFICPDMKLASCTITDKFVALSLFMENGRFFNHDLVSECKSAIHWGNDLFHHYRAISQVCQLPE